MDMGCFYIFSIPFSVLRKKKKKKILRENTPWDLDGASPLPHSLGHQHYGADTWYRPHPDEDYMASSHSERLWTDMWQKQWYFRICQPLPDKEDGHLGTRTLQHTEKQELLCQYNTFCSQLLLLLLYFWLAQFPLNFYCSCKSKLIGSIRNIPLYKQGKWGMK